MIPRPLTPLTALALAATLAACGDAEPEPEPAIDGATCGAAGARQEVTSEGQRHLAEGTAIDYSSNPPCIGDHFPIWLEWGVYDAPVDPGYYVHNLEHGGVAFLYDCPEGCPEIAQALIDFANSIPADDGGPFRFVVMPFDGDMPARVAAVAWGKVYTNDCVNPDELAAFVADNYRKAPEDVAVNGIRPGVDTPLPDNDD